MKKIITIAGLCSMLWGTSFAQQTNALPGNGNAKHGEPKTAISKTYTKGLSPFTARLIAELYQSSQHTPEQEKALIEKYDLKRIGSDLYVNAFVLMSETGNVSNLLDFGVLPGKTMGSKLTALIPIKNLIALSTNNAVKYIQVAEKAKTLMEEAKGFTWVDLVHNGVDLDAPYHGTGVVVGIIDIGFDYTHPNFYDSTLSTYRVQRVWEQNNTVGNSPSSFNYGVELIGENQILAAEADIEDASHGTHVAGIAAGGGAALGSAYMGVAPESEIVLVSVGNSITNTEVADAIAYIFEYADMVEKPCVINMSLGQHIGPHDGESFFDKFCDDIVSEGRLLVGAAGNEGEKYLHLNKTFVGNDSLLHSFVFFPYSDLGPNGQTILDIWGTAGDNFQLSVNIYNKTTQTFVDFTPYINAAADTTYGFILSDGDMIGPDECTLSISTEINELNNKPRILIELDFTSQDDTSHYVLVEIIAKNTHIDMWASDIHSAPGHAEFESFGFSYPWVTGSNSSTVGEIGGTGNSVITVGAYTSKNQWTNLDDFIFSKTDTLEAIAPFSSLGPTADGRTKPDITAPGNVVFSSVSSYDSNYGPTADEVVGGISIGNDTWYFAKMEGTSMATPMVTGILALWLQAYPYLTTEQAKMIMKANAYKDSFTGNIGTAGSNVWGWGKIDAHEGILDLISRVPEAPSITPDGQIEICDNEVLELAAPEGFDTYYWSNDEDTETIEVTESGTYAVKVKINGFWSPWSDAVEVEVFEAPPVPTITVTNNILTSSATTGNQWYLNGTAIAGATAKTHTAIQSGMYMVVVTADNDCASESESENVILTSLQEGAQQPNVAIYPNPAHTHINITMNEVADHIHITLYDPIGRVAYQTLLNKVNGNTQIQIPTEKLEAGIYTIQLNTQQQKVTHRIVIAH